MPLTFECKAMFGTARASPSIFSLDFFAASGYSLLDGSVHTPSLEFDKRAGAISSSLACRVFSAAAQGSRITARRRGRLHHSRGGDADDPAASGAGQRHAQRGGTTTPEWTARGPVTRA